MNQTSSRELSVLRKLKEDLVYYAPRCLKIKDKYGHIVPFNFNRAQQYLHVRLEDQRRKTGKVRAVIVKGRQQGCCFSPETKVLTADYRWIEIGKISPGEKLISIDENLGGKNGGGRRDIRRIRQTIVEAVNFQRALTYKLLLDNGTELIVTAEHRFLCKKRGGDNALWRKVKDLRPGDDLRAACYRSEDEPIGVEDGWIGGMLDGEGSFGAHPQIRLAISQVDGPVLGKVREYLHKHKINFYEQVDKRDPGKTSKLGTKDVFCLRVDCLVDILRLLVRTQPVRFVGRFLFEGKKLPKESQNFKSWTKVISITSHKIQTVVDLQTSHKTYIAEGIVSHNSTYLAARNFHAATLTPGTEVFILSHISDSTDHLFDMAKLFHEQAPPPIVPVVKTMNEREMEFEGIHSSYRVGTAGNKEIGRSLTVQRFHGSEVAKWENTDSIVTGLLQAIPDLPGTEIVFESTANGVGNMFHKLAMKGIDPESESDFMTVFIPWFWQEEYAKEPPDGFVMSAEEAVIAESYALSPAQIYWRRRKVMDDFGGDVWKFRQEYPCTVQEAFVVSGVTLLDGKTIEIARKSNASDIMAPVVLGCDPARSKDRTVIVMRRGREVVKWSKYSTMDEMTLAGIIANLIDRHNVVKAFIDTGYGWGTIDRLRESGYGQFVTGVHFGGKASEPDVYLNKRSEMYDAMRAWFAEGGVRIPDDDDFHMDLLAIPPLRETTSRGLLALPPKEEIKKLFGKSPDIADALALTFSFPVASRAVQNRVRRENFDRRRSSSPLSTVRDFNRSRESSGKNFHSDVDMFS